MSSTESTPVTSGPARRHQYSHSAATARADRALADAWTVFWREQRSDSRCCANAPADIRRALDDHWGAFAASLPPAANILDIGCGTGAVGRELLSWRADLRITGVDFANILPSRDPRNELLPCTPMESLPFADRSFRAVVSQFGYEYGRSDEAAQEIARVLVPDGRLSFLVHHRESPIVIDSDRTLRAIEHLTGARLQAAFMSGMPAALEQILSSIRSECPAERIVEQAAGGLHRRISGNAAERAHVWRAVVDALTPELVMASSLQTGCVGPEELVEWLGPLVNGFELMAPSAVRIGGGKPVAWKIEGRRH